MKKFFVKIKDWFIRHKPSKRRLIQVYAALLYNANIKGFITGNIYKGNSKTLCVPGLNCYSCPGAVGACPLGALQNALSSSGTRAPAYVFGIIILFGLLLGRTVCGFLCPVGLFQDLVYKIKTPKLKKSKFTRIFSYFKYVLLVGLVVIVPIMFAVQTPSSAVPGFCKYICPAGTLGGAVSLLSNPNNASMFAMLGPLFTWKFALLVVIVVASVFIYRFFCRFFCPLGAIYGLFCKIALLGVKLDKNKCTDCGLCLSACKMDIKHVGDHECINCGDCISACPTKAISWKGSQIFLHPNAVESAPTAEQKPLTTLLSGSGEETVNAETNGSTAVYMPANGNTAAADNEQLAESAAEPAPAKSDPAESAAVKIKKRNRILEIAAWAVALAVLLGALLYYNVFAEWEENVDTNSIIGTECPDFSWELYGEEGTFTVSESKGKVLIINYWATWCGPCVEELPYFNRVANDYADQVDIVAVHDTYRDRDVTQYLQEQHFDEFNISFVQDETQENCLTTYKTLGGGSSVPMTVILDKEGVIRYSQEGSMTYDKLVELITPYL